MTTLAGVMVLVPSVSCLPEPSDQRLPSPLPYKKAWTAMTTDIDLFARPVAGVDTHTDTHTVSTVTATGRHPATETFPTTRAGYTHLTEFLNKHGVGTVGVEGTNSFGAGLTRHRKTVATRSLKSCARSAASDAGTGSQIRWMPLLPRDRSCQGKD